jgi:hypothetical protein
MTLPRSEAYRAAMRLVEQYGEAAVIAAILRADPVILADDTTRQVVIDAIAELQDLPARSKPS